MSKKNTEKKFFWFKFGESFFNQISVKYLETLPDSAKLIISYQKLIIISLENDGYIRLNKLFPSPEEEIAMLINQDINNIRLLLPALLKTNAIEWLDNQTLYMLAIQGFIGKEGSSAKRVREYRQRQKEKMLQSNGDKKLLQANQNGDKTENEKPLQCNIDVTNR